MTDKQKTYAQKRLYGKSSAGPLLTTVLIILIILEAASIAVSIWLEKTVLIANDYMSGLYIINGIYIIFIIVFADLLFGYYSHSHILVQQYESLTQDKREMLLELANRYGKRKNICTNGTYIYGNMAEQRPDRKRILYPIAFRYIKPAEVIWAYVIQHQATVGNALNPGYPTSTVYEYKLRLYLQDGRYLQGSYRQGELKDIFDVLKEQNPSCKLGYKKEYMKWLKERT